MKKRTKTNSSTTIPIRNPVAKFAGQFNRGTIFQDKRQYRRNAKHKRQEPFAMPFLDRIAKGFCFYNSHSLAML